MVPLRGQWLTISCHVNDILRLLYPAAKGTRNTATQYVAPRVISQLRAEALPFSPLGAPPGLALPRLPWPPWELVARGLVPRGPVARRERLDRFWQVRAANADAAQQTDAILGGPPRPAQPARCATRWSRAATEGRLRATILHLEGCLDLAQFVASHTRAQTQSAARAEASKAALRRANALCLAARVLQRRRRAARRPRVVRLNLVQRRGRDNRLGPEFCPLYVLRTARAQLATQRLADKQWFVAWRRLQEWRSYTVARRANGPAAALRIQRNWRVHRVVRWLCHCLVALGQSARADRAARLVQSWQRVRSRARRAWAAAAARRAAIAAAQLAATLGELRSEVVYQRFRHDLLHVTPRKYRVFRAQRQYAKGY
jgi:hypothetical protein